MGHCEYVHYFPYLTLPRNGRIQQKFVIKRINKKYRFIKRVVEQGSLCPNQQYPGTRGRVNRSYRAYHFCSNRQNPRTKGRVSLGRKNLSLASNCRCQLSENVLNVWLNQTDSLLRPFGAEGIRINPPEEIWSSHLRHYQLRYVDFPEMT